MHFQGVCEEDKVFTVFEAVENIQAPIQKGQKLGKAKVYIGDKLITTAELFAKEDIEKRRLIDMIRNFFSN